MKLLSKSGLMLLALVSTFILSTMSSAYAEDAGIKELRAALSKRMPSATNAGIKKTPVKGIYEVTASGQIMYMTQDSRFIFDGDLYDMQLRKNITEDTRGEVRLNALKELGEENMLVYMPKGKVKHTITVFTDIYCPYCRKLHNELADYKNNGVKVRYIFVPFKGEKSVETSVSVWCADDKNKALDLAKSGADIEKKTCKNPINKHQILAADLGIRGTPAIMLESGQLLPGYVPSAKLLQQLKTMP